MSGTFVDDEVVARLKKRLATPVEGAEAKQDVLEGLVQLKKRSRELHEKAHVAKEAVAELSQKLDAALMALQCVEYEKRCLQQELELVSEVESYNAIEFSVPLVISSASTDAKARLNDKLQRIKSEIALRMNLAKEATSLEVEIAAKKADLAKLRDIVGVIKT